MGEDDDDDKGGWDVDDLNGHHDDLHLHLDGNDEECDDDKGLMFPLPDYLTPLLLDWKNKDGRC